MWSFLVGNLRSHSHNPPLECLGMGVVISVMQPYYFLVKLNRPSYIALICAFNSLVGGGRGLH